MLHDYSGGKEKQTFGFSFTAADISNNNIFAYKLPTF